MKMFELFQELSKLGTGTESEQMLLEKKYLVWPRVAINLQFVKKKKSAMIFQSTVKRRVIKEAMLALILQNWGTHTQLLEILLFWLHLQGLPSAENYWAQICTFPSSVGTDPVAGNIEAKGAGFLLQGRHFWNDDPSPTLSRAFWDWVDTL